MDVNQFDYPIWQHLIGDYKPSVVIGFARRWGALDLWAMLSMVKELHQLIEAWHAFYQRNLMKHNIQGIKNIKTNIDKQSIKKAQNLYYPAVTLPLTGRHLIEASAGTGKTWTLTGVMLRLIVQAGQPCEKLSPRLLREVPPPKCASGFVSVCKILSIAAND